jgi:hypothetical protein
MKVPNIGFYEKPYGVNRVVLLEGRKVTPELIVDAGHFYRHSYKSIKKDDLKSVLLKY